MHDTCKPEVDIDYNNKEITLATSCISKEMAGIYYGIYKALVYKVLKLDRETWEVDKLTHTPSLKERDKVKCPGFYIDLTTLTGVEFDRWIDGRNSRSLGE